MNELFDRLQIPSEYRPLAIATAIAISGAMLLFSCCGGCVMLFRGERPPPASEATSLPRRQIPPDVVAEVEQTITSDYRAPYEVEVVEVLTRGPASERIGRVLNEGTLQDFFELRAEERLSLCHRVANRLHPERDADARAARARTYFDLLHLFSYANASDHKTKLIDRLALIESKYEAAQKSADELKRNRPTRSVR